MTPEQCIEEFHRRMVVNTTLSWQEILTGVIREAIHRAELGSPCAECGHTLARHTAMGEGLCLDCRCAGWTRAEVKP